jgi:hypothetical protein
MGMRMLTAPGEFTVNTLEINMKTGLIASAILMTSLAVFSAEKEKIIVQAPDGTKIQVKVPQKAIEKVTQTGPNSYDVKVNKEEMKKIEVKVLPEKK